MPRNLQQRIRTRDFPHAQLQQPQPDLPAHWLWQLTVVGGIASAPFAVYQPMDEARHQASDYAYMRKRRAEAEPHTPSARTHQRIDLLNPLRHDRPPDTSPERMP